MIGTATASPARLSARIWIALLIFACFGALPVIAAVTNDPSSC